jgi:heat-inducible transcriptional repressor
MLSERQQLILQMIIEDYVHSAEPVGSRTISKRGQVKFSPATIRNEMSDLEDLGFLEQPHTSAGRIPSQKGYRFYVDHLLNPSGLASVEVMELQKMYVDTIDEMERMVQQTAQILSSLTNYTSLVLGPQVQEVKLRHIQLIPLTERSAVAILVTDKGHVENKTVSVPEGISTEEISKFVEILNKRMVGVPMNHLKSRLYSEIMSELRRYMEHYDEVMTLFNQILQSGHDGRVYLGGTAKILNQPEFQNIDKLRPLLDMLEANDTVIQLLNQQAAPGIQVRIGLENEMESLKDCSLVTATYQINGKPVGTIGVLGPTRMDYGHVISVMGHFANRMSEQLTRLHK